MQLRRHIVKSLNQIKIARPKARRPTIKPASHSRTYIVLFISSVMQNAPSSPPSATRQEKYDVIWRQGALGLNFTPNERDQPVICQVPESSSPDVLQSPAAVGDVLVAFQLRNAPVVPASSFRQTMRVLKRSELPIALRFASRKEHRPEALDAADVATTYTFTWQPQQPLGVSLAMDPCSLHTIITRIDPQKISPDFSKLEPQVGDVLVGVRGSTEENGESVQLDRMRFENIISTLREFPRPSQLTFARLVEDQDAQAKSPPVSPSHHAPAAPLGQQPKVKQHPRLRPIPFASRQSFRVEKEPTKPAVENALSPSPSRPAGATGTDLKGDEKKFYKVIYAGGRVGLQLRDCSKEDSEKNRKKKDVSKTKTKGYSVCIKEVSDARSAPGLENGSPGDLLMAIGRTDLQHLSFEHVHRELGKINTPTELLFKKRALGGSSSGGSLVDALFLFLI